MDKKTDQAPGMRRRIRQLRRARRYLAEENGNLARLLRTYARMVEQDPDRAFLSEQ